MSVYLETSLGALVIDLHTKEAPIACKNFLKLCKIKYYHGCLFYNVQPGFMVQTGDPTATGRGGTSVYGLLYGDQARFFEDEIRPTLKHNAKGVVSMANMGSKDSNSSQFFITLRGDDNEHLDGKHTIFGRVEEGLEVLDNIGTQFIDDEGRPYCDIRVLHSHVLDDPFPDPPELETHVPPASPTRERPPEERLVARLAVGEDPTGLGASGASAEEVERLVKDREARSHAVVLEMLGDLPDADAAPPENVLFVCKLNPVTTDDDLEIVFSRFGKCRADIVRDHITGDSLNFAFVEFENVEACEEAYRKMDNVLIDDRRIKVDFSQSVAKQWQSFAKGRAAKTAGGSSGGGGGRGNGGGAVANGGGGGHGGGGRGHGGGRGGGGSALRPTLQHKQPLAEGGRRSRWGAAAAEGDSAAPTPADAAANGARKARHAGSEDSSGGGRGRDSARDYERSRDERDYRRRSGDSDHRREKRRREEEEEGRSHRRERHREEDRSDREAGSRRRGRSRDRSWERDRSRDRRRGGEADRERHRH